MYVVVVGWQVECSAVQCECPRGEVESRAVGANAGYPKPPLLRPMLRYAAYLPVPVIPPSRLGLPYPTVPTQYRRGGQGRVGNGGLF